MKHHQPKNTKEVLDRIEQEHIKYVRLFFTDVLGRLKGMSITKREMKDIMEQGQGFDGSSVEGFVRIEESDLMAWPDPVTFRILPWEVNGEKVAMMICDIKNIDDTPFAGDPRYALKKIIKQINELGYTPYIGPEFEYFYFKNSNQPEVLDNQGYFDYSSFNKGTLARKKAVIALEAMGIKVECSHHEVAPSQHEIDLRYDEALAMADYAMIYRMVIKELAEQDELYATFMPKPIFGQNGSGMHIHQSLFKNDKNAFFDKNDKYSLSKIARRYTAGLFKHIRELSLVTNQWVNSYKRLVPGFEAPCYISWGRRNRSSLIRVPQYRLGREQATRIELRSPDPACNPYLAFAVMLAAGLDGIKNKYPLPEPIEEDIYHMPKGRRQELGIDYLPPSIHKARIFFEQSELMQQTLGKHIFHTLIANKKIENEKFKAAVTDYEIKHYLPVM